MNEIMFSHTLWMSLLSYLCVFVTCNPSVLCNLFRILSTQDSCVGVPALILLQYISVSTAEELDRRGQIMIGQDGPEWDD